MPKSPMQAYRDTAEDAGYTVSDIEANEHAIVVEEPGGFVLVLEDTEEVSIDEVYYVGYFSKVHMDYACSALFEGTLLECLEFVSNREPK